MTNQELANLIFKDLKVEHDEVVAKYPKRDLKEGAAVTRYAPSPTGFVHMGNIYAAYIERKVAKQTNGVFYLRIEDTDQKRYVKDGIQGIINDMRNFNIEFDECPLNESEEIGKYGPYIQSQRKDIYHAFAKKFVELGRAYPCFCSEEELTTMRERQKERKDRLGYYGPYAKCRKLTNAEMAEKIKNGEPYVMRFKSMGNFNDKVTFTDLVKGTVTFPANDKDEVILKSSDGLPTYHFAHLVDDTLMRTTHVIRDHNWFSSVPFHLELFKAYGEPHPNYAHIPPVNKKDGDSIRKLSKRKDPEAAASYYHEKGIPVEATLAYVLTISNSNFEAWYQENLDKSLDEFIFDFSKSSKSGPIFDVAKLFNISENYISRMKASELYEYLLNWALEFDSEFADLLTKYKDYSISILNIEREQEKPRKDYACYSEIKSQIWYMYDELFDNYKKEYDYQKIIDKKEIKEILTKYIDSYYDLNDDKETWFNKVKLLAEDFGYAANMKDYKNNPDNYKGNVADIATVIRVALTKQHMTPDLYEIMKLFGVDRIKERINKI